MALAYGLGGVVLLIIVSDCLGARRLTFDDTGFTARDLFWRVRRYEWHSVSLFRVWTGMTGAQQIHLVVFEGSSSGRLADLNRSFCGADSCMGGKFGMAETALTAILNAHRTKALGLTHDRD